MEWEALEFNYHHKERSWFIITGLIAGALFIWAIFTKNILFALFIGLSYFSIIVYGLKRPRRIKLAINAEGVKINQTLYPYDTLKSFWIFYEPPEVKELSLRSKKLIMPYIKIPLGDKNPVEIRRALIKYLPERRQQESVIDNISRQIKF